MCWKLQTSAEIQFEALVSFYHHRLILPFINQAKEKMPLCSPPSYLTPFSFPSPYLTCCRCLIWKVCVFLATDSQLKFPVLLPDQLNLGFQEFKSFLVADQLLGCMLNPFVLLSLNHQCPLEHLQAIFSPLPESSDVLQRWTTTPANRIFSNGSSFGAFWLITFFAIMRWLKMWCCISDSGLNF